MAPATTTRGFTDVSWVRGLFGRHEDDAGRLEKERPTVEAAEKLDGGPALGTQHAQELVGRVQAELGLAQQALLLLEPPVLLDPARADVEPVLDADRALGQPHGLLGRHIVDEEVAVARVEDEGAARLERRAEPVEQQAVFVVGEVPDAGEEVQREIELAGELHVAHVLRGSATSPAPSRASCRSQRTTP